MPKVHGMKGLAVLLAVPLALAARIAVAGTPAHDASGDVDLLPEPDAAGEQEPASDAVRAAAGAPSGDRSSSCATCDGALGFRRDVAAVDPGTGAATEEAATDEAATDDDVAEGSPEREGATSEPPSATTLPTSAGARAAPDAVPQPAADPRAERGPSATIQERAAGRYSVVVVIPSGARTEIVLDRTGRILDVRNVEAPGL